MIKTREQVRELINSIDDLAVAYQMAASDQLRAALLHAIEVKAAELKAFCNKAIEHGAY